MCTLINVLSIYSIKHKALKMVSRSHFREDIVQKSIMIRQFYLQKSIPKMRILQIHMFKNYKILHIGPGLHNYYRITRIAS